MIKEILDILEKTYNNDFLRKRTVPLFMSDPGLGKTSTIKRFAKEKEVKLLKLTLSQRMPNEVVGMMMPNIETGKLEVFDSYELTSLQNGDILFIDEVFNGTLKQTLDSFLNLLEDRTLPSGKQMADIMIVAASNPQGLINLTPQIKERFIKFDLKFNSKEFEDYLKKEYGMPHSVSSGLCTLIRKEKFEDNYWNFNSPRSMEKAINQTACGIESDYYGLVKPHLMIEIESPIDLEVLNIKKGDTVPYFELLKLIIKQKNDTKNNQQKARVTHDILN